MKRIPIFRPGKHKPDAPNITAADAQRIADSYDKKKHHAPLVIGHPASHDRAYGWVDSLSFKDGTLYANLKQVNEKFAKIVRDGAYKYLSAAFYRPNASVNPAKGESYYLRHLGCLGAVPPAVKGLPALAFGEGEDENDFVSIDFEDAGGGEVDDGGITKLNESVNELTQKIRDLEKKTMSEKKNKPSGDDENVNLAEREAALEKERADLDKRVKAFEKKELAAQRKEHESFAEDLVSQGKLLPRHKDALVEFLAGLSPDHTVNFAAKDGEEKEHSALELMRDVFSALPKQIEYAEIAKDDGARDNSNIVNFNAPAGMEVDKTQAKLHKDATKLAREKNIPYAVALVQVSA